MEHKQPELDNGLSDASRAMLAAIAPQPDVVNRNGDVFSREALKNAQFRIAYGG